MSKRIDLIALEGQNVNFRDKSLKVLQYGSRFLMGFYGSSLTGKGAETLRMSVHNVLLVRRAARYVYFINFLRNAVNKLQKLSNTKGLLDLSPNAGLHETGDGALVESIEVFEQLVWVSRAILSSFAFIFAALGGCGRRILVHI
jgi:hypothetical protein